MSKTKQRILSVGLTIILMLAAVIFIFPTADVKASWDGTAASSFAGGDGSDAFPYLISNAKELALLAEKVNNGDTAYNSKSYKLTADIYVSGKNWTAIGTNNDLFSGTFDGDGHVISGININKPNESNQGLFGNSDGIIKNVGVEDSIIIGYSNVAGVCAFSLGRIENCYNTGDVRALAQCAGGICGYSNGDIYNCYNTGTISGDALSGGICGDIGNYLISCCYNAGKVSGRVYAGSICGSSYGSIADCYYSKDICSVGGISGNDISGQAEGISTKELCNILSFNNFDSSVWSNGTVTESENGMFRETVVKLPYFKNIGDQQIFTVKYYNFGIDGNDDWQPYTPITTADELQAINDDDATRSGNYVLMNDIVIPVGENNFTAIGNDNNTSFTGKFSGNGHIVSGININKTEDYPEPYGYYLGLFGYSEGLIMNVNVADSSIIGRRYTGAVCGFNDRGTVWGCSGSGSVKCTDISAGGVCGYNQGGVISQCYNTGDVSGPSFVGGICGYNFYSAKMTDCYNAGKVTVLNDYSIAGGVCSYNSGNSIIENCYSAGSLICTGVNSEADGICYNINFDGGTVTNCYYNTDFCEFESTCGTGITTLEMVNGKMTGFDTSIWTHKPIDKTSKVAYYPALVFFGNDNPIGFETKLDIALSADSETVYGGDYSFDISALVKFDGMNDFRADTAPLTTAYGKYTVVCGDKTLCTGDIYDNTIVKATYSGKDIPRDTQTITLKYDGTGSDFFTSETTSFNADVTHSHTISEGYSNDETSHWKTCSVCDDKIDLEKHIFDEGVITGQPTNGAVDEKTYTCKVCGYKKIENISHEHNSSEKYFYDETNHWKTCSGCDEKLDTAKHSFDGGVITTEATKETEGKKIYTCTICGYKKTEIIGKLEQSYPIVISGGVTASKSNAEAGETVDVSAPFGYDIIVADAEGRQIAKITEKGSFTMPASGVVITTARGEIFAYMTNAWNHSYVYSYDSDMNRIKVNSDAKRGVITIDLGVENAGRNFTIYSGRKNTSKKLTEGVLDENGKFTFSADEGRNYTLVLD